MVPHHVIDGPSDAPFLVLGSSLGTSVRMWEPQLPALTQRFRVVRYEHPGHGGAAARSDAFGIPDLGADVVELLDHLGAERVSLGGLSLGGMVAMWVAATHAERIDRLVLACTGPQVPPPQAWADRAATVRAEGCSTLLPTLLGRWFTTGFADANPAVAEHVAAMLADNDPESYARCCEALAVMDLRDLLPTIQAPTLIVAGARDPVSPPAVAAAMCEAIPDATLVVLSHASHLANLEQPAAFTDALLGHLASPRVEGARTRREVLGDAHVDRSTAGATPFTAPFLDYITRCAWGEVWTRPGLDRRTRSAITVAMLVALGRFDELGMHLTAARRNGLSDAEIGEILLQSAVYCGAPAANSAFHVAQATLGGGE